MICFQRETKACHRVLVIFLSLISPITTALTILLIIHQSGSITSWIFMRPNGSNDDQFEDQLKMFDVEINQWKMAFENL